MAKTKKKVIIDVDKAIALYNEQNPQKKKLDRKVLAKKLDLSYQSLVNYQGGAIPDLARALKEIINLTGITFDELVTEKKK